MWLKIIFENIEINKNLSTYTSRISLLVDSSLKKKKKELKKQGRAQPDAPGAFDVLRCLSLTLSTLSPNPTVGVANEATMILDFKELQSINPLLQTFIHLEDHLDSSSTLIFLPYS